MKITIAVTAILAAVFLYFAQVDLEAARADSEHYCQMVKAGRWPDYEKRFDTDCAK